MEIRSFKCGIVVAVYKSTSSACNDNLCCSSLIVSPFTVAVTPLLSPLISCACGAVLISNSRGDEEQPCLHLCSRVNHSDKDLFNLSAPCGLEYNVWIHFMKLGPNWNCFNV